MNPLAVPPATFARVATRVVELSCGYLESLDDRSIMPGLTGEESLALFGGTVPEIGIGEAVLDDLARVADACRAGTARLFPYVVGPGEPIAATADLLASVLNQNVTAWRSSPAGAAIEHTAVRWLADAVGCEGFRGSLTSGGSTANLMGLALAREARVPANESGAQPCVVYTSGQAHMSIGKAAALLGSAEIESARARPSKSPGSTSAAGTPYAPSTWSQSSAIAKDIRQARLLADLVERHPRLELLAPVALSAVCFRRTDRGSPARLDELNEAILGTVNARGKVALSNASINGAFALRACIVNHLTTDDDIRAIVDEVLAADPEPVRA